MSDKLKLKLEIIFCRFLIKWCKFNKWIHAQSEDFERYEKAYLLEERLNQKLGELLARELGAEINKFVKP